MINKHELTQVHRDIKQESTSIFHSTGCFPVFTVLCTNLTNEQCEPCSHMDCSETLVCLDFCLSENKPTQVEKYYTSTTPGIPGRTTQGCQTLLQPN